MIYDIKKTMVSISERTYSGGDVHPSLRRENRIIIHDGSWQIGFIRDEDDFKDVLNFLEVELIPMNESVNKITTGRIDFYYLSKPIHNSIGGGFWSLDQLKELSKGEKLKKFKGLSNGSIVDCYIGIADNIVNIYRPNPNAKEVYETMSTEDEIQYRLTHWYL